MGFGHNAVKKGTKTPFLRRSNRYSSFNDNVGIRNRDDRMINLVPTSRSYKSDYDIVPELDSGEKQFRLVMIVSDRFQLPKDKVKFIGNVLLTTAIVY